MLATLESFVREQEAQIKKWKAQIAELKKENQKENISINGEQKIVPKGLLSTYNELQQDRTYIEVNCMNNRLTPTKLDDFMKDFFVHLANQGETYKEIVDAKFHFSNWLRGELKKAKEDKKRNKTPITSFNSKSVEYKPF